MLIYNKNIKLFETRKLRIDLICFFIAFISIVSFFGCTKSNEVNELLIESGLNNYSDWNNKDSYNDLKYNKDYKGAIEIQESNKNDFEFMYNLYVWNNDLRYQLYQNVQKLAIALNEQKDGQYKYEIDNTNKFILKQNNKEIFSLNKSEATGLLYLIFPKQFYVQRYYFFSDIAIMAITLEYLESNNYEVVKLKCYTTKNVEHNFLINNYEMNKLYGLSSLEEIKNFAEGKYLPRNMDVNTGGNYNLNLNNAFVNVLYEGKYYWIEFTPLKDSTYIFYTEGNMDTTLEIYSHFNFPVIISDSHSGNMNNAKIELYLNGNKKIFIKVYSNNSDEYGGFSLRVDEIEGFLG